MSLVSFNADEFAKAIAVMQVAYRDLPLGLQKRQIKSALRKVATPYVEDFRGVAPKGETGSLKKSATVVVDFRSQDGRFRARVGYGRKRSKPGYHAILVHDGTKERFTKDGQSRGKVIGTAFARPVVNVIKIAGTQTFVKELHESLEAGVRQLQRYISERVKIRAKRGRY